MPKVVIVGGYGHVRREAARSLAPLVPGQIVIAEGKPGS
jgi:hypothetical protein